MATEFTNELGRVVARRWWGGDAVGAVVQLFEPLAAGEVVFGDDGSVETCASLLAWQGRGAVDPVYDGHHRE